MYGVKDSHWCLSVTRDPAESERSSQGKTLNQMNSSSHSWALILTGNVTGTAVCMTHYIYTPGQKSWCSWPLLTISPFLPPIQCWISALKVSPLKQHCMWGEGRAVFGKKSLFQHWTRDDDENIANFQGVPHTFDQDCKNIAVGYKEWMSVKMFYTCGIFRLHLTKFLSFISDGMAMMLKNMTGLLKIMIRLTLWVSYLGPWPLTSIQLAILS